MDRPLSPIGLDGRIGKGVVAPFTKWSATCSLGVQTIGDGTYT